MNCGTVCLTLEKQFLKLLGKTYIKTTSSLEAIKQCNAEVVTVFPLKYFTKMQYSIEIN